MKHQSTEAKFFKKISKFLTVVAKYGSINRFVAAREIGLTPRQYEQLHPYLLEAYADQIQYNADDKSWRFIGKLELPQIPQDTDNESVENDEVVIGSGSDIIIPQGKSDFI